MLNLRPGMDAPLHDDRCASRRGRYPCNCASAVFMERARREAPGEEPFVADPFETFSEWASDADEAAYGEEVNFYRRRAFASSIATWMEEGQKKARETGDLEALRRPYIQNVDLVVAVMKDYAAQRPTLAYALRWWWKNRVRR